MPSYKQSTVAYVPVTLVDGTGNPVTGVVGTSVTAAVSKNGNTTPQSVSTTAAGEWAEITTAPYTGSGTYWLKLSTGNTDTLGPLLVGVSVTGAVFIRDWVQIDPDVPGATVSSVTGNVGGNVTGSVGSVTGAVGSVSGNVGGNVSGSVGSVAGNVSGSVASVVGDLGGKVLGGGVGTITGTGVRAVDGSGNPIFPAASYTAPPSAATNAAAVWDEATSSHTTSGTFGRKFRDFVQFIQILLSR